MPGMDIRNFFGKKGGPPATKKKKGEEAAATPAEAVHKKSNPVVKQVESKKANASPKQQHQEQPPKHTKKKLVIVDSDDDDDDAVVVEKVVPSKRKASTSRAQAPREAISAEDYFIDSDAEDKPATKKTKKPEMNNFFDEDSDDDDDDGNAPSVSPTKRAKTLAQNSPATGKSDDSSTTPRLRSSPRAKAKTLQQTNEKVPASRFARKKSPPPKRPPVAAVKRDAPLVPLLQRNGIDMDAVASLCLTGYTFVFTGVMTELAREEAVEKIKILGGRVTTTVSSKTDYLVLGEILEDGRPTDQGSKYKRAIKERNVAFVQGATAFYGLLQQYSDKVGGGGNDNNNHSTSSNRAAVKPQTSPPARLAAEMAAGADSTRKLLPSSGATVTSPDPPPQSAAEAATTITVTPPVLAAMNPYAKKANPYIKTNPYATKKAVTTTANGNPRATDDGKPAAAQPRGAASTATPTNGGTNPLWVDKYKPVRSSEILGNQDAVRKLSVWLASWEERFNSNANIGKTYSAPNGPWKAALLSGPPGIGKTTTATLVAQESGRDVLEFNASDVRSKKAIKEEMGDITGSHTLEFRPTKKCGGGHGKFQARRKRCIIMDEVDGMGAGDRSGVAELILMIKSSRVPIICICNDRQSPKMKSLLPYCMDLRYRRPIKSVIANRAIQVARQEGLSVEQNAAEAIVESCGNDVRQVLNCLQMWSSNSNSSSRDNSNNNNTMTYKSLKEREHSINKDEILRVSLFDATRVIVEGRKGLAGVTDKATERSHFFTRNDAYFVDYNFVGLMVQQNYLKIMQPQFNDAKRLNDSGKVLDVLERMHDAAQSMSDWAVVDGGLHGSNMNWSLLPATAALCVKTGYHAGGNSGGMLGGFPEFTTWLGRNSSRNKKVRLLSELCHHMNYKISSGTMEMRMSYLPLIRDRFLLLLTSDEPSAVEDAIALMDEYGLDRDDIFEKLDEFNMDPKADTFQKIDSKKKASFTRLYNQGAHKSQALVDEQGGGGVKKVKRQASGTVTETGDPDAIDDDKGAEEDGDDDADDELDEEKIRAAFRKKGRGKKAATAGKKAAAKPKAKPKVVKKGKK